MRVPEEFKNVKFTAQGLRSDEPDLNRPMTGSSPCRTNALHRPILTWEWDGWSLNQTTRLISRPQVQGTQLLDDGLKVDPTVELESGWLAVYVTQTIALQVQHGDLDKT